jgi:hypothetical protein
MWMEAIYLVWFAVLIASCWYMESGKTGLGLSLMFITIAAPLAIIFGVAQ